jgi:hypothetical protein
MKLRNHTEQWKRDYDVQPPLTDAELGALETQEIEIVADDTAPLDADMTAYAAFLTRLLTEGNEDDK